MRDPPQGRRRRRKRRTGVAPTPTWWRQPTVWARDSNDHFEHLQEKPYTNHVYPVKHKLKFYELLKRILG
jgi:hypothetical protein